MNRYAKGARLERRAQHTLEADGWLVVRSAGSHGPIDLVAFKGVEPVKVIQVKSNLGEKAAMREYAKLLKRFHLFAPVGCEIWVYLDGKQDAYVYP